MASSMEDKDLEIQLVKNFPLCRAINARDVKMVDQLLQQPDLDLTEEGDIALGYAIYCNAPGIAYKLIQKGVDPNVCLNLNNWTLLHEATSSNYFECVCLLLSSGIDLQISRNSEESPLILAYSEHNEDIMKALLYHYYEFDGTDLTNIDFNFEYVPSTNEDILLLFIALHNGYAEPFKIIWSKIDIKLLAMLPMSRYFLTIYLFESTFTPTEWLDCLYLILESPQFLYLLDVNEHFLLDTLQAMKYKIFESDRELQVLYMCLSVGINVKVLDIVETYNVKSVKQVAALIYNDNCDWGPPENYLNVLLCFVLDFKINCTTKNICYYFLRQLNVSNMPQYFVPWFTYFSLPRSMKTRLLNSINWYSDQQKDLLDQVAEFPSLLELARVQVQKNIRKTHTIKRTYQFHDAVKELCIPKHLKDVILFKTPIYL